MFFLPARDRVVVRVHFIADSDVANLRFRFLLDCGRHAQETFVACLLVKIDRGRATPFTKERLPLVFTLLL
jgi:hypothetical protein